MGNQVSEEQKLKYNAEQIAGELAHSQPFPGPLTDAFVNETIQIGQFKVRPIMLGDWIILQKIDSPLFRMLTDPDVQFSQSDVCEIAFQFTRPAKEIRSLISHGVPLFKEKALEVIGDSVSTPVINELVAAVRTQLERYYNIQIKYAQDQAGEGEARVVNFPASPA